ncbi:hypothetical protein F4809DRAFT_37100 [Biscogniauxia mediterranea]|nr:hypothetical protein F4809DRAFT_37100 [Biscogniauxia mediterranea]
MQLGSLSGKHCTIISPPCGDGGVSCLQDGLPLVENRHSIYSYLRANGLEYGPLFQGVQQQRCNESGEAIAEITLFPSPNREGYSDEETIIRPISLDAISHLCFAAYTAGGSRATATSVPSRISCLWVANGGLGSPKRKSVIACTNVTSTTKRGFSCEGVALDTVHLEELCLWYEGLELTNVTDAPSRSSFSLPNPKQFCMNIDSKIALNMLVPAGLDSVLQRLPPHPEVDQTSVFRDIEMLIDLSLRHLISSIEAKIFG